MIGPTANDTYVFSPSFSDLTVRRELLEKILGYKGGGPPDHAVRAGTPAAVSNLIEEILPEVPSRISVRCGFRILPVGSVSVASDSLSCNGVRFTTGAIIAKRLRASTTLAPFVATIGSQMEDWSRELMAGGDPVKGFIVDAIASETVEQVAEWLEKRVAEHVKPRGWNITNRYSPGYCGWSVAEQHELFSLLPERFCGVSLTVSSLMIPIKSVSGVIGLGPTVKRDASICSICDLKDCFRRQDDPLPTVEEA
ncbi:MAG: vitamin B12 dependent-methionine synthase activation domain-containing protein [Bacteroidota bacterium]